MNKLILILRAAVAAPFVYGGVYALMFGALLVGGRDHANSVISKLL